MTIAEFVAKWGRVELTERSASQQHFLDLCAVFAHPTPAGADAAGEWFTFERGAAKQEGGRGWADVWKRGFFGWEYKGKHKDLRAAYNQLLQYRETLENPPLLVVCDMERIRIHSNFTATANKIYEIPLAEMGDSPDAPSPIFIINARRGSTSPIANSTTPSPPLTVFPQTSPMKSCSRACSRSISDAPPEKSLPSSPPHI